MAACIVQTSDIVTLVGAGPINRAILADTLTIAPFLVAADGGAEIVQNYGKVPNVVIGDLDSVPESLLQSLEPSTVHKISEQDSTDFDKALRNIQAPLILGVGFTGGRIDHQLSCLRSLAQWRDGRCILLGDEDIIFRLPARFDAPLPEATRISLYPVGPGRVRGAGLRWPLDDMELSFGRQVSQSNATTADPLALRVTGDVLAIVPRRHLDVVMRSLLRPEPSDVRAK